ncbi:MAG: hypothetical protein JRI55_30615 [Deltaproteobacteria bacterium]|nr:hypothetical protein [Deltaproteobacteria bacterium]
MARRVCLRSALLITILALAACGEAPRAKPPAPTSPVGATPVESSGAPEPQTASTVAGTAASAAAPFASPTAPPAQPSATAASTSPAQDAGAPPLPPGSECADNDDCRLVLVHTCAHIRNCTASCPGVGQLQAIPMEAPAPPPPECGPQPPCRPSCPQPFPIPAPPRVACESGKCVVQ